MFLTNDAILERLEAAKEAGETRVDFANGTLDGDGVKFLAEKLAGNQWPVKALDLSNNNLRTNAKGLLALYSLIRNNKEWLIFYQENQRIYGTGISKNNETLTKLNLKNNRLKAEGIAVIASALVDNTTLCALNLSNNRCGDEGIKNIATALVGNTTLRKLDLSNNGCGDEGAEQIACLLKKNKSLRQVNFANCLSSTKNVHYILIGMSHHPNIMKVNLAGNKIDDDSMAFLQRLLRDSPKLTWLNLDSNHINDNFATVIARNIENNTKLTYLSLNHCEISTFGAKLLVDTLRTNQTLKQLKLRYNKIDKEGVQEIIRLLKEFPTITTQLDLSGNPLINVPTLLSQTVAAIKKAKVSQTLFAVKRPYLSLQRQFGLTDSILLGNLLGLSSNVQTLLEALDPNNIERDDVKKEVYIKIKGDQEKIHVITLKAEAYDHIMQRTLSDAIDIAQSVCPTLTRG